LIEGAAYCSFFFAASNIKIPKTMKNIITLLSLFVLAQQQTLALTCTWIGGNSDWNIASNWDTGTVPTGADDVIINAMGSQVNISTGASGTCNNLTKGGFLSRLVVASGGILKILGNLTYNGGIFSGDVSMAGSSLQLILGISPLTLNNLNITNQQGVLMSGNNMKLSGTLSLQGPIYTNGLLLEVAAISGGSPTAFVVTGDNLGNASSSGGLAITLNSGGAASFPVGPTLSNYAAVKISNTAGPAEKFTVAVINSGISQDAVKNTWNIGESTPGGNTATLTLEWDQGSEGGTFNRAACSIYKVSGSSIVYTGYNPQVSAASSVGAGAWAQTLSGVTSFSEWAVNNNTGVLPITLLYFAVEKTEAQHALISWAIDVYSNPAYFEVEKSRDALSFVPLRKILALDETTYQIEMPLDQWLSYYRLKMVDTEGKTTYSKIQALDGTGFNLGQLQVFPNPFSSTNQPNIVSPAVGLYAFSLLDQSGRNIRTQRVLMEKGQHPFPLSTECLAPGLYLLATTHPNGQRSVLKLVVE
jgi:hypothetical protein